MLSMITFSNIICKKEWNEIVILKFFAHFISKSVTAVIAGIGFAILYTIQFSNFTYLLEDFSTHLTIGTPIAIVMFAVSVPLYFIWGFISTFLIERWIRAKKPLWNVLGVKCLAYVLLSLLIAGSLYLIASHTDWFIPLTGSMILFCFVESFLNRLIDKFQGKVEQTQEIQSESQAG